MSEPTPVVHCTECGAHYFPSIDHVCDAGRKALALLCEVNRDGWVGSGMTLDVNIMDLLAETDHAKCTRDHCEVTGHGGFRKPATCKA